jgi:hypothetical protein
MAIIDYLPCPMPDPTTELQTALRAAHFALIESADHIRRTKGQSSAYRRASNASAAVRDILIKRSNA